MSNLSEQLSKIHQRIYELRLIEETCNRVCQSNPEFHEKFKEEYVYVKMSNIIPQVDDL